MATIAVADAIILYPDDKETPQKNLEDIFDHIRKVVGERRDYVIKLELAQTEKVDLPEVSNILEEAQAEIERQKNTKFVPHSVDKEGNTLFSQESIKK